MAITWGTPIRNSNGWEVRIGYERISRTYVGASTLTSATTAVEDTYETYVQPKYTLESSSDTLAASGDGLSDYSKTVGFSALNTGGQWLTSNIKKLDTSTHRVSLVYGQAQNLNLEWSLSGIYGFTSPAVVTGTAEFPARPYYAPTAPTGVGVTRSSDTQHTINWTRNSPNDPSKPYQNVIVQRWADNATTYVTVATVGNVSSYTDTGTVPGRRYRYRVAAKNSGGQSAWAYSDYFYTTPEKPTNATATRQGSDILVEWTKSVSPHSRTVLAYRPGSGAWVYPGWSSTGTSYLVQNPDPSVPYTYAVRAEADSLGGTVSSGYLWTNEVRLQAPPSAPTNLTPSVADAAKSIPLRWKHNPVDSSAQSAYEVQYRPQGSTGAWTTTGKVASTASARDIAAGTLAAGAWEVQVRTWGAHATASGWSSALLLTVSRAPSVTITSPTSGTFTGTRAVVSWSFLDPDGSAQTEYLLSLYDASTGDRVWSRQAVGTTGSYTIPYTLLNGGRYTIGLKGRDVAGLWSPEDAVDLQVSYAPPPRPGLELAYQDQDGSVLVSYWVDEPAAGEVAAVSARVERSTDGGPWVLVREGLPAVGVVTDPAPALGPYLQYRVTAVSSLPSEATSDPVGITADADGWAYLNSGPGLATVVRVRGATKIDASLDTPVEFVPRSGTGDLPGRPIVVISDEDSQAFKVSARLAPVIGVGATYDDLRTFVRTQTPPVLFRDPTGERIWGVAHGLTHSARGNIREASFMFTETDADGMEG